ncbi:MAG: DJ-1/PfpI family protein [Phycisphaerales bacterium]|nr:MAG: DJ-1/PfpI family protein [Phycisphaerales bacterium]
MGRWLLCVLILLDVGAVCWGQQRQTRGSTRGRAPRTSQLRVIQLPAPVVAGAGSIEQALSRQQNLEAPTNLRLTFSEIGQLLWAAQGVTVPQSGAAAIPDALIPMKVFVALPDGLYLYSPSVHALQQLRDGDMRAALATAVLSRPAGPVGGCQIIVAGSSADFSTRFGSRAKTAMLLLAGQMAQSIQLQAVGQDLTYLAVNNIDTLSIRRICRLDRALMPLYIAMVGYPPSRVTGTAATQIPTETTAATTTEAVTTETAAPEMPRLPSAKALIITPQREFQDEELFQTKFAFESALIQITVASSRSGRIVGSLGAVAEADLGLNDIKIEDYDAIVFIGGAGAVPYASNAQVQNLVRQAVAEKKILAASGTAALILASADVVKSARITGMPAHQQLLALAGAVYTGTAVERDGPMITSAGPLVAPQFARTIVEALAGQ